MNWHMTVCGLRDLKVGMATVKLTAQRSSALAFGTRYLKQESPAKKSEDVDWDVCNKSNAMCTWRPECVLDLFILLDKTCTTPILGISMYDPEVILLFVCNICMRLSEWLIRVQYTPRRVDLAQFNITRATAICAYPSLMTRFYCCAKWCTTNMNKTIQRRLSS